MECAPPAAAYDVVSTFRAANWVCALPYNLIQNLMSATFAGKTSKRLAPFIFLLLLGCGQNVAQLSVEGQSAVRPVIDALEQYRAIHGSYPDSLDQLIEAGLLDRIPTLPLARGVRQVHQLEYHVAPNSAFYYLKFSYDIPQGLSPGSIIVNYYVSDVEEWKSGKYPPSFNTIVASRMGATYQKDGSSKALDTAVEYLIKEADGGSGCVNLFRKYVVDALGEGVNETLPAALVQRDDLEAMRYSPTGQRRTSYVFVFYTKQLACLNEDGRFVDKDFPVVRAVYALVPVSNGKVSWKEMASCR